MSDLLKPLVAYNGSIAGVDPETMLGAYLALDSNTKAHFRADTGVTGTLNASNWADQSGNGNDLVQATGAAQPYYEFYDGDTYGRPIGTFLAYAETKTITGNITMTVDASFDLITPAVAGSIVEKIDPLNGFRIHLLTSGKLRLQIGDGTGLTAYLSTDTIGSAGVLDNTRHTYKAEYTDGASGNVKFYIDDVQLGTTVATTKTLTDSSSPFNLTSGSGTFGKFYRTTVTDGASTTYYDCNFAGVPDGATSFNSGGDSWTLNTVTNTGPYIVGPGGTHLMGGGVARYMQTAGFTLNQPVTHYLVARKPTWTVGKWQISGLAANAGLITTTSTPAQSVNAGSSAAENSNITLNAWHAIAVVLNGASSSITVNNTTATTGDAGSNNPGGLSLFSDNAGANLGNMRIKRWIVRANADTAAQQARIIALLHAIYGTPA